MSLSLYNENDPGAASWLRNLIAAGRIEPGTVAETDVRKFSEVYSTDSLRSFERAHFFAGIGGWPAALDLAGWPRDLPVWTGSCPCFTAGTLVLTRTGMKAIESIETTDEVLTHRGRWRRVNATMRSHQPVVTVKGQGHWGLKATPEHPFLTGPETWSPAASLVGKRWACVTNIPRADIPPMPERSWRGRSQLPDTTRSGFWQFLGYWLGDGWCREEKGVVICGARDDGERLQRIANGAGLRGSLSIERTGARLRIGSKLLARWLTEHFGSGALTKRIPTWVLAADKDIILSFLDGYRAADGHAEVVDGRRVERYTTASRAIAVGIRILANRLGESATITRHDPKRECVIEGRTVTERGFYRVTVYPHARSFKFDAAAGWGLVRSVVHQTTAEEVFNIAVEEDESYTADGLIVHNCQPFSSAGRKKGFDDARHLWPHWFQLIRVCRPPVVLGEQVEGPAGRAWLDAVFADLEGAGYACGAAVLPAAGAGAPHARHRLYFVAVADGERREGIRLRLRERRSREGLPEADRGGEAGLLADAMSAGRPARRALAGRGSFAGGGEAGLLADAAPGGRREGHRPDRGGQRAGNGPADDRGLGDPGRAGLAGRPRFNGDDGAQRAPAERAGGEPRGLGDPGRARGGRDPGALSPVEAGRDREGEQAGRLADQPLPAGGGFWSDVEWIACRDGKSRPVEPGTFPLVAGLPGRVVQLRGYGNAICVPLAAQFIGAVMESLCE